jgi:acyl-CoA thioester hydrolase
MLYKHKVKIQIRFCDIDMLGHLNNANYLSYMEMARVSYFRTVLPNRVEWNKEGIILAKATIQYKKPIFLDDSLYVEISVSHISHKSFMMEYRFVRIGESGEDLCAEANTLMVCYDYVSNESMAMPTDWEQRIRAFEGLMPTE